jgi:alpha-glucoside transport system permease protein
MMKRALSPQKLVAKTPLHLAILIFAAIWIIPTLGLLLTSFRDPTNIAGTGWWTVLPRLFSGGQYSLENYVGVLRGEGLARSFLNSLFISVPATAISTFIASFAAFGFAWMRFTGRRILFMLLVGLMVIPLQMTFIPILPIYSKLGLAGTFPGIWLAHTAYGLPLTTYLVHNFMAGIPKDLFDSAAIDGASPLKTFWRIVIPISVPALASVFIFQFLWIWNDLLVALVYLGAKPNVAPLTVSIANLVTNRGQDWELLTAAAFVSMALPLVVFFSLQRYFVRGILAGSVKG